MGDRRRFQSEVGSVRSVMNVSYGFLELVAEDIGYGVPELESLY